MQTRERNYKDNIQQKISNRRRSVANLSDLLAAESERARKIYTNKEYVAGLKELNAEIKGLKAGLQTISSATDRYRKATIFDVYNTTAKKLFSDFDKAIAASKCKKMPTKSEVKSSIIKICQKDRLGSKIKKARKTKACSALNENTPSAKIAACIKAYRTENNLKG